MSEAVLGEPLRVQQSSTLPSAISQRLSQRGDAPGMADRGRVGYGQATPKLSSFLIKNEFAHHYQKMAAIKNRVPFSKDSTLDNAVPHTKTLRHLQFNGKAEADRVIREKQINKVLPPPPTTIHRRRRPHRQHDLRTANANANAATTTVPPPTPPTRHL